MKRLTQIIRVEIFWLYGCAVLGRSLNQSDDGCWEFAFVLFGLVIAAAVNIVALGEDNILKIEL